jgi:hypothetical protein
MSPFLKALHRPKREAVEAIEDFFLRRMNTSMLPRAASRICFKKLSMKLLILNQDCNGKT